MNAPLLPSHSDQRDFWDRVVCNESAQVRVGWKLLAFAFMVSGFGIGLDIALRRLNGGTFPVLPFKITDVLVVLLPTWILLRLEKRPLVDLGLRVNRRWFRDLALGFLLACVLMALASSGVLFLQGGWMRSSRGIAVLVRGLSSYLGVALFEELVFRGYPFQRMVEGWGERLTLGLMAAFFVLPHILAGLHRGYPWPSLIGAALNIGCGALLLGFAFLWTRSLALPIGIHWGWNWMQGTVLGLSVSGTTTPSFLDPARPGPEVSWITGGLYGPEAGIPATLAVIVGILLIHRFSRTYCNAKSRG